MDTVMRLNEAMKAIEAQLETEFDVVQAACMDTDSFARFFGHMTGMTLGEYVRRRRLTQAAFDLQQGQRIIDVVLKYGWSSADAFSRAFVRQHGLTPSEYRRHGGAMMAYPPVSFEIIVKGGKGMEARIVERPEITVYGISATLEGQGDDAREALRHNL